MIAINVFNPNDVGQDNNIHLMIIAWQRPKNAWNTDIIHSYVTVKLEQGHRNQTQTLADRVTSCNQFESWTISHTQRPSSNYFITAMHNMYLEMRLDWPTQSNITMLLTKYLDRYCNDIVGMTTFTFTEYQQNEILDKLESVMWI